MVAQTRPSSSPFTYLGGCNLDDLDNVSDDVCSMLDSEENKEKRLSIKNMQKDLHYAPGKYDDSFYTKNDNSAITAAEGVLKKRTRKVPFNFEGKTNMQKHSVSKAVNKVSNDFEWHRKKVNALEFILTNLKTSRIKANGFFKRTIGKEKGKINEYINKVRANNSAGLKKLIGGKKTSGSFCDPGGIFDIALTLQRAWRHEKKINGGDFIDDDE